MSTTDKTGEKLVQTIRKSKAAGASRRRAAPARSKPAAAAKPETTPTTPADPYQSGGRVWPD